MGNQGNVYKQYYMPNFVDKDCLAIFLGTTQHNDLVQAVSYLEHHSRALDNLNNTQKDKICNYLELIKLA